MVYAMRNSLRNAVNSLIGSGLSGSLQVPSWLTTLVTRLQDVDIGVSTYALYQAVKTLTDQTNIDDIHNAFANAYGVDIGRVITTGWDSINDKIVDGTALRTLNFAKGVGNQATALNHSDYTFTKFFGVWSGDFQTELTNLVIAIELYPAGTFTTLIGYIDDLTTSCLGGWGGLGYSDLNDAIATLGSQISSELTTLSSDTTPITLSTEIEATTVAELISVTNTVALTVLTQYTTESMNIVNIGEISSAMSDAATIQNLGNSPRDPLFLLLRGSLTNDAQTLFLQAPNLALTNSILAPRPNETASDTYERVKKAAQLPTPTYSTLDILYKAAAYDSTIPEKYLRNDFDPRDSDQVLRAFDSIASDFSIDPCGGDRALRQKYLKDHLDSLELGLLMDRVNDVRTMLTD
jgi:hypothetical protein